MNNLNNMFSGEITEPFCYFYGGLHYLVIIEGELLKQLNYRGYILNGRVSVNTLHKKSVINDVVKDISDYLISLDSPKLLCTLPRQIQLELRQIFPNNFWMGLSEKEEWYKKDSLITFKQTISNYQIPPNILNSVPQFIRAESEELKSLVSFVKTIECYLKKKKYYQYVQDQVNKLTYF